MSSILTAVFKATIGLIVHKGRDKAAEKLKEGDVTGQQIRSLIVREIDDIKSKLAGLSRKDLLASISFFEEGIEILFCVFGNSAMSRSKAGKHAKATGQKTATAATASALSQGLKTATAATASALSQGLKTATAATASALTQRTKELDNLDQSDIKRLSDAKNRFTEARRKATEAFNNESLKLSDRLLAMKYRVVAAILETIDTYLDAFPACQVCLKELHALPEVQNNFKVQVQKRFRSRFRKDDRVKIMYTVCQINHVIYDIFGSRSILENWPYICVGGDSIDPLRDWRVAKVLRNASFSVPWSFGDEGVIEEMLGEPCDIVTNSKGDLIISELSGEVYVFNKHGKFLRRLKPSKLKPGNEPDISMCHVKLAIDQEDTLYILTTREYILRVDEIEMLDSTFSQCYTSFLSTIDKRGQRKKVLELPGKLQSFSVNDNGNFYICGKKTIYIYDENGQVCRSLYTSAFDNDDATIRSVASDGDLCLITVERTSRLSRLHFFTAQLDHLRCIDLVVSLPIMALHQKSGHVVIAGYDHNGLTRFVIYSDTGECIRKFPWNATNEDNFILDDMTFTPDGHIAVVGRSTGRVLTWTI